MPPTLPPRPPRTPRAGKAEVTGEGREVELVVGAPSATVREAEPLAPPQAKVTR